MQQLDYLHRTILPLPRDGGVHLMEHSHLVNFIRLGGKSRANYDDLALPQPS